VFDRQCEIAPENLAYSVVSTVTETIDLPAVLFDHLQEGSDLKVTPSRE